VSESELSYFPLLSDIQKGQLLKLRTIYDRWNSMINVISRKDMDNFFIHHVLHSLSIAKVIDFLPGTRILDVGTGGGFPGIPLAILYPDAHFTLVDSIEKKIKVVIGVAEELELKNVSPVRERVEEEKARYDFVISRAVTKFPEFVVAVIVVFPAVFAVTSPVSSTVAIAVFNDFQVIVLSVAFTGKMEVINCVFKPFSILAVVLLSVIDVGLINFTPQTSNSKIEYPHVPLRVAPFIRT